MTILLRVLSRRGPVATSFSGLPSHGRRRLQSTTAAAVVSSLPTRHSWHGGPRICRDAVELQELSRELLETPVGHLYTFEEGQDGGDAAQKAAFETIDMAEYLARGFNAQIPTTFYHRNNDDDTTTRTTTMSPQEALSTLELLLQRMKDEGDMYLQVRAERMHILEGGAAGGYELSSSSSSSSDSSSDDDEVEQEEEATKAASKLQQQQQHPFAPPGPTIALYDALLDAMAAAGEDTTTTTSTSSSLSYTPMDYYRLTGGILDGQELLEGAPRPTLVTFNAALRGIVAAAASTTTTTTTTTDHITFGNSMRDLPTCLPSFDRILRGGVRMGTVTELVGKSGTGKTQLALQLCIAAAKFNQGAIYIDSEKKLSLPRLREMSERWRAHGLQERRQRRLEQSQNNTVGGVGGGVGTDHHHPGRQFPNKAAATRFSYNQGSYGNSSYPTPNSQSQQSFYSNNNYDDDESNDEDAMGTFKSTELVLGNLTLHQPGSSSELLDVLDALEDEILQRNQTAGQAFPASSTASTIENITTGNNVRRGKYPVRLLIVDSIASPMRRDFGTDSAPQRASAIFQCAQKLKRLADQLHLAVVVINQVGSDNRAALGTSWHHCVSTRLMLETATTTSDANKVGLDHSNGTNEFGTSNVDLNNNLNSRQSMQPDHRITRKIAVVKSNKTGFGETGFEITTMGIVEDSIAGL
jgi:RecA/RadA recombinase